MFYCITDCAMYVAGKFLPHLGDSYTHIKAQSRSQIFLICDIETEK